MLQNNVYYNNTNSTNFNINGKPKKSMFYINPGKSSRVTQQPDLNFNLFANYPSSLEAWLKHWSLILNSNLNKELHFSGVNLKTARKYKSANSTSSIRRMFAHDYAKEGTIAKKKYANIILWNTSSVELCSLCNLVSGDYARSTCGITGSTYCVT